MGSKNRVKASPFARVRFLRMAANDKIANGEGFLHSKVIYVLSMFVIRELRIDIYVDKCSYSKA